MEHHHYYITPDVLPKPDDTDTEWMQRTVMLANMLEDVAGSIFTILRIQAPIVVAQDQLAYHLLAGVGLVLRGIAITGRAQLEKAGRKPLDAQEDQLRVVRNQLAKPDCDPELREALLTILAHNLEAEREAQAEQQRTEPAVESSEWPAEGFVLGGDDGT